MNGVHDLGGMDGFGAIVIEHDEPVFHQAWQARVFGIANAATGGPGWTLDFSRHTRERMPPALYLASSYYERWLIGREAAMLAAGLVTTDELSSGHAKTPPTPPKPPAAPDTVWPNLTTGYNAERSIEAPPRFAVGDSVMTRNMHPVGHTRLPRYARAKPGRVHAHRGVFVLPDTNAHGRGENPEHLYTVEIAAGALWGETANQQDKVYLDLWESYLDAI